MTAVLAVKIAGAETMTALEDIYLPFRPKKKTKATVARDLGLEPLAEILWAQDVATDPKTAAAPFVGPEIEIDAKKYSVPDVSAALAGARDILAERFNDDATARLAGLGLTARQYNYLSVIYVEENVTPNEIGTLIHTANPTVTSMLNALERDGLIARKAHPDDGRSSVVRLTAKGKTLYEKAFALHHDHMEETMGVLSDDERRTLVNLLVKLGDAFLG